MKTNILSVRRALLAAVFFLLWQWNWGQTTPTAYNLGAGDYSFTSWSASSSRGTYPNNMIFWVCGTQDPTVSTQATGDWLCVYNQTSGRRVLGKDLDGMSFISSGNVLTTAECGATNNGGNPFAAVLSINTTGRKDIAVSWVGRTVATGERSYKLILQYKIGSGAGGEWINVNEYIAASSSGSAIIPQIILPQEVNNNALVQLRWMYNYFGTNNGTRPQLGLDEINVTSISSSIIPEPTAYPSNFICGTPTTSTIPLTWTDAAGTTPPQGYLVRWSSTSFAAIPDPVDGTPVPNGANAQNIPQGTQTFTATGLSASSTYYFKIWSYTNSGTDINYKLAGEPQISCATTAAPCNFLEDFTNSNARAPYADGSFVGNNSITWTYTEARDQEDFGINGKGIMLRNNTSKLTSSSITNGISNFTCKLKKGFTGAGNRQVELFINGVSVGSSVQWDNTNVQTFTVNNINIPGNVVLEIRNVRNQQVVVDDIEWICFSGTPEPNINIQGNGLNITSGDTSPSAADFTDFGTAIIAGTNVERTFTLQNSGSAPLNLDNPAIVLLDGTKGFTVSAQPAANTISAFGSQTFKINFSNTTPDTYTETVMIGSNDPDTPLYTFDVKAVVISPIITAGVSSLSGFTYAFGQGPSSPLQSFVVNGSNLGANITVKASANWQISTNQTFDGGNVSPWDTIILNKTAGNTVNNRTVYVRLKNDLNVGNYSGTITLSSPGATAVTVNLTGSVTAGIRDIKVTGSGTNIPKNSTSPSGLNNTLFASQNIGESQTKIFEITNLGGAPLTLGSIGISGTDASSFTVLNGPAPGTVLNQHQNVTFEIRFAPTSIGIKTATVTIYSDDPSDSPYPFMIQGRGEYCSSASKLEVAQQGFEEALPDNNLTYTTQNIGSIAPGPKTGFSSGKSTTSDQPDGNNFYSEGARGYRIQGADDSGQMTSGVEFTFETVDVSGYTGLDLIFKVAGFSLGSTGNGMDCNSSTSGETCVADDQKADFVLVEISPDNGANWYRQAKVVSDEMNLPWSFGSNGTEGGSRAYAANNSLTYFKSTSAAQYSAVTITNLPQVTQLKVRITAQNNAVNESWIIDEVKLMSTGLVPKTWNGSAWSPSAPQSSDKAIITGNYDTEVHGSFAACQCEIKNTATVTIGTGTFVQATDFMKNDGTIIVKPDGNFIQLVETDSNSGNGTLKAIQNITVGNHQQYNYLISPTANTNLKDIYRDTGGNPVEVPFVLYHDEKTNKFFNSSGAYIKGRALAVKEPVTATAVTAEFSGIPANGTFTYTLVNSNPNNVKRGYNLIGNPYPSNLDLIKFYQDNSAGGHLSPTFYFWDNNANTQTAQAGDGYLGEAYATFNAATPAGVGTPIKAKGDSGTTVLKLPTKYVKIAQGFMAKLEGVGSHDIAFTNSSRKPLSAQGFFGKNNAEDPPVDRYWLNMINPNNIASNIAVVYFIGGIDGFTREDSRSLEGSDALYSWVDGEKVSVNGKSSFVMTDKVELASTHFAGGNYTIQIDRTEGIFANGQKIYLKDHQTGLMTDLSEASYTFEATAGESTGRFIIVYRPENVLLTDEAASDLTVYRDGDRFVVLSKNKNITEVELYDAGGRQLLQAKPKAKIFEIDALSLPQGVYFLKIMHSGELISRKLIR